MQFEIERLDESKLKKNIYRFDVIRDFILVLNAFEVLERKTTRHNFFVLDNWSRLSFPKSTLSSKPNVPDDVLEELKQMAIAKIQYESEAPRTDIKQKLAF